MNLTVGRPGLAGGFEELLDSSATKALQRTEASWASALESFGSGVSPAGERTCHGPRAHGRVRIEFMASNASRWLPNSFRTSSYVTFYIIEHIEHIGHCTELFGHVGSLETVCLAIGTSLKGF